MSLTTTQQPVDIDVLLFYSGVWNSIRSRVYERDTIMVDRGAPNEASTADPLQFTFTVNNTDGMFCPRNPNSSLFGLIGRNTPAKLRAGLRLSENLGMGLPQEETVDYATTPDTAALDIVGDIDVAAEFTLFNQPAGTYCLLGKGVFDGTTGTQLSYQLLLGVTNSVPHVTLRWSTGGTSALFVDHDMSVIALGKHMAVRVTLDVDNGASGRTLTFYTSDSGTIAGPWTQHGSTTVTAGTTSIFSGSGGLSVGAQTNLLNGFPGAIHAILIKNGIAGTAVANPVFSSPTPYATAYTDAAGRVWALQNAAYYGYYKRTLGTGEISAWPVQSDVTGKDIYSQITASGISRRLSKGKQAPVLDTMTEFVTDSGQFIAYWPGDSVVDKIHGKILTLPTGVTLGGGTLGTGTTAMALTDTGPTRDGNGYLQSGYIETIVASYTSTHFAMGYCFESDVTGTLSIVMPGFFIDGHAREWEVRLRGDGVNNDIQVLQRDNNYNTQPSTITQTALGNSASLAGQTGNGLHMVWFTLDQNGSGIDWRVYYDGLSIVNGTVATQNLSSLYEMHVAYSPLLAGVMNFGYLMAASGSSIPSAANVLQAAQHYLAETAGDRMTRLTTDAGVSFGLAGATAAATMPMGPQPTGKLLDILSECAATDGGLFQDRFGRLGLQYTPRAALYAAPIITAFAWTDSTLQPYLPTDDDQSIANVMTASNADGTSWTETLMTGALSIQAPPAGVNEYPGSISVNAASSSLLPNIARWELNKSTVDAQRYPSLPINMLTTAVRTNPLLVNLLMWLGPLDQVTIVGQSTTSPPEPSPLILMGTHEELTQSGWTKQLNCQPGDIYQQQGVYGSASPAARYDFDGATVGTGFNTSAASASVAFATKTLATTDPTAYPQDVMIAGERMTVSSVTGTSSPQTFNFSARHVNGISKAHVTGEEVHIYPRYRYGL